MIAASTTPLVEELVPTPDPVECCERLAGLPYRIWLDSAAGGTPLGRYSFLTADPSAIVRSKGARLERQLGQSTSQLRSSSPERVA